MPPIPFSQHYTYVQPSTPSPIYLTLSLQPFLGSTLLSVPQILFFVQQPLTDPTPFNSFPCLSAEPNGGVLGPKIVAGLWEDCWLRGGVLDLQNWCWICGRASGLGPEKKCWVWEMGTDPQHTSIIPLRNLPPSSMASMPLRALPALVSIRIPLFS